ncbi:MAG: hypothetical protein LBJ03_01675 [Holosporales bacterium]|jgi:hypothetical protein|nr:hypothetical protein [Holosporales bacterium]
MLSFNDIRCVCGICFIALGYCGGVCGMMDEGATIAVVENVGASYISGLEYSEDQGIGYYHKRFYEEGDYVVSLGKATLQEVLYCLRSGENAVGFRCLPQNEDEMKEYTQACVDDEPNRGAKLSGAFWQTTREILFASMGNHDAIGPLFDRLNLFADLLNSSSLSSDDFLRHSIIDAMLFWNLGYEFTELKRLVTDNGLNEEDFAIDDLRNRLNALRDKLGRPGSF